MHVVVLVLVIVLSLLSRTVMAFNLVNNLLWRSALKRFVPVSTGSVNIEPILEAIRLSPSSFGIQPYHVHVITNAEVKKKLKEVSYNQDQVTTCSHLLVFCARNDPDACVERIIQSADVEKVAPPYAQALRTSISSMTKEDCLSWASSQAMVALGIGLAACAELKISSCPMGGFIAKDVHQVLQLPENQWPVVYLAIGSTEDPEDLTRTKLRLKSSDLYQWHK